MNEEMLRAKRGQFFYAYFGHGGILSRLGNQVNARSATVSFVIFILLILARPCAAQNPQPAIWKVIMAEAVSEGYSGMYAVACVIRNRGGDINGFCGSKRKDLEEFCQRQGNRYITMAKDISHKIFVEGAPDTTGGATHYEAVEIYGEPYWTKGMTVTAKIGEHTFYKERKRDE